MGRKLTSDTGSSPKGVYQFGRMLRLPVVVVVVVVVVAVVAEVKGELIGGREELIGGRETFDHRVAEDGESHTSLYTYLKKVTVGRFVVGFFGAQNSTHLVYTRLFFVCQEEEVEKCEF
jgi:hypothetical protein